MYVHISDTPLDFFPYHIVALGGRRDEDGNRLLEKTSLEILTGIFSASDLDVDALIVTSDLQGTVVQNGEEWLLGEKLPEFLKMLLEIQFPQIGTHRVGVVLCGDLYANLEKRGGIGDVREVWLQFKANFAWVAGVAGNHDHFGARSDCAIFKRTPGIYFCQRESRSIGKAQIAGISGIIGRPEQPNRMTQDDFLAALKQLLLRHPEFILLHEGPDYPPKNLDGNPEIRSVIEKSPANLIFCGHRHWPTPLINLENGTQIVNVDKRVVILLKDSTFAA